GRPGGGEIRGGNFDGVGAHGQKSHGEKSGSIRDVGAHGFLCAFFQRRHFGAGDRPTAFVLYQAADGAGGASLSEGGQRDEENKRDENESLPESSHDFSLHEMLLVVSGVGEIAVLAE